MEPFAILSPYDMLVCMVCRYCVLANEIPRHLKDQHPQLTPAERLAIFEAAYSPELHDDQRSLRTLRVPTEPIPAIPELLGPFNDGFRCDECRYISRRVCGLYWVHPYEG